MGFVRWLFLGFLDGFFIANPASRTSALVQRTALLLSQSAFVTVGLARSVQVITTKTKEPTQPLQAALSIWISEISSGFIEERKGQ